MFLLRSSERAWLSMAHSSVRRTFVEAMSTILIFVAAFASVGLGCFQTINVVNGWPWRTALTSIVQGTAALTLYRYVPYVTTVEAAIAFILGGICGGQLSLYVTRLKL
jgi:hypothetical protein